MSRKEELEARRREIAEAAWRVLVREGLREVSVRKVAAEAGLPPSSLRYIVPTQADLHEQAIDLVLERLQVRIDAVPVAEDDPRWAHTILLELVPLDAQRRTEMEVFLALGAAAMANPDLLPAYLRVHEMTHDMCARAVRAVLGEHTSSVEVDRLHGLIDGLSLHIVRQPPGYDGHRALAVLDMHLAQINSPEPTESFARESPLLGHYDVGSIAADSPPQL